MSHGQEGHHGYLHALRLCGDIVKSGLCGDMVKSQEMTTFSAKTVSDRPPGFTLSESVIVGRNN